MPKLRVSFIPHAQSILADVWALEVEGREVTLLVSFVVAMALIGVNPPSLNGLAVFADKHALALAHASEGGKCRVWEKWPTGQPQAGGSEYLELHGAFSITLRAPGAALLSKVWFPCRARSAGDCVCCCFVLSGGDSPRFTQASWSWKWRSYAKGGKR
jgi:hypothetical protein